jgi:Tol biopolymer transport system component
MLRLIARWIAILSAACVMAHIPVIVISRTDVFRFSSIYAWEGDRGIYVADLDHFVATQITRSHDLPHRCPLWGAGNQLAFLTGAGDTYALYSLTLDDLTPRNRSNGLYLSCPTWSPKGDLAFAVEANSLGGLSLFRRDRQDRVNLSIDLSGIRNPGWLSDHEIVFSASTPGSPLQIYVVNVATGAIEAISNNEDGSIDPVPALDQNWVAFTSIQRIGRLTNYTLHVWSRDTDEVKELVSADLPYYAPAWSGDGKLAFVLGYMSGSAEIYVWDSLLDKTTNITNDPATEWSPSWLRDGRMTFFSNRDDKTALYTVDPGTQAVTLVYSEE